MQPDNGRLRQVVERHLLTSAGVKQDAVKTCTDSILAAADLMVDVFRSGGKLLLCGNGGSAADCQHVAAELTSSLRKDIRRPALPAVALTTDTSFLTAFANDFGFEGVFDRQVQALGKPGDGLIGISTSGKSTNVVRALEAARSVSMRTVVLTGKGGFMADIADVVIAVPSEDTQYIQETHLSIEHILCDLVERQLFGESCKGERPQ